jgi:broad specificity phosphatase PhoE
MVQLILVRPGSTDYDLQARIQGTLDIPLNDAGRTEAAATAEKLRAYLPTAIYCCTGSSAEETAAVLGQALNIKPKTLDRLQNINLGLWQGMLVEEVRRKQPKVYKQWQEHPEMVHPPEGEMLSEVLGRTEETLEKLARKHRSGTIVLVVPEPIASVLRHRIEGGELGDLWRAANVCRIDVLQLEPHLAAAVAGEKQGGQAKSNGHSTYIYRGSIVERP